LAEFDVAPVGLWALKGGRECLRGCFPWQNKCGVGNKVVSPLAVAVFVVVVVAGAGVVAVVVLVAVALVPAVVFVAPDDASAVVPAVAVYLAKKDFAT